MYSFGDSQVNIIVCALCLLPLRHPSKSKIRPGTKVEARYRGKTKRTSALVSRKLTLTVPTILSTKMGILKEV